MCILLLDLIWDFWWFCSHISQPLRGDRNKDQLSFWVIYSVVIFVCRSVSVSLTVNLCDVCCISFKHVCSEICPENPVKLQHENIISWSKCSDVFCVGSSSDNILTHWQKTECTSRLHRTTSINLMFQFADREPTGTDGSVCSTGPVLRRRPADLFYIFRFYSIVCFTFVLRDACNLMLVTEWWSVVIQIFNIPTAEVEQKLRSGAIISFILLVFTDWITSTSTQTTSICPEPSTQTSLPPSSVECVQFIVTTATTAHKSAGTLKLDLKYTDGNKPVFVDCPEESWTPLQKQILVSCM